MRLRDAVIADSLANLFFPTVWAGCPGVTAAILIVPLAAAAPVRI